MNTQIRVFVLILFLFSLSLIAVFIWSNSGLNPLVSACNDTDSNSVEDADSNSVEDADSNSVEDADSYSFKVAHFYPGGEVPIVGDTLESRSWIYGKMANTEYEENLLNEILASVTKDQNFSSVLSINGGIVLEYYVSGGYIQINIDKSKEKEYTRKDVDAISEVIQKHAQTYDYSDIPIAIDETVSDEAIASTIV